MLCYFDDLLEPIVEVYNNYIPFTDDFPHEIHRWRNNVHNNCVQYSCTPETALNYTSDLYPNVNHIMQLLLCLTVGSCCVERSFSPLRKLKTWIRSSMTKSILCRLSMLHIHRSDTVGEQKMDRSCF
jgi:hypothetical protein